MSDEERPLEEGGTDGAKIWDQRILMEGRTPSAQTWVGRTRSSYRGPERGWSVIRSVIRQLRGRRWAIMPRVDLGHSGVLNRTMIRAGPTGYCIGKGCIRSRVKIVKKTLVFPT